MGREADQQHGDGRIADRQVDRLGQGAMAIVIVTAAEGLGDERVEAEQEANAEEGGGIENGVADADGADGGRAETAHHDGVHDRHGDPAEFREHDGDRQQQERFRVRVRKRWGEGAE